MSKSRGHRYRERTQDVRDIDPALVWFVARTKPAQDVKAEKKLGEASVDVWRPVYRATVVRRGRKIDVERRFFAGYLFVGLRPNDRGDLPFRSVLDCEQVYGLLGNEAPVPFPTGLLQMLADRLAGQDVDETERGRRREAAARFDIGLFYRVVGGPFSSFFAEVTAVLNTGLIRADVNIFGRPTPVEFDPYQLAAA